MGPRVSILELTEATCRWPLGDPGKDGFGYCGSQTKNELPYCPYHARLAYQPASDRRRHRQQVRNG
jgi:GcrA cell cycle regulator